MILVTAMTATSAADLRELFLGMPDSIMPTLTKSERMDFMDYIDSGMKAKVRNKLGGESVMTLFEDNMLTVQTSGSGRLDMVLYDKGKDNSLICIVRTVNTRYEDSRLQFFTQDWKPVPAYELIDMPKFDDYLTKEALRDDSVAFFKKKSMLRLQSVTPVGSTLEFRYTSLEDLGGDADKYRSWFKTEPVRYIWNGKRFKRK